MKQKWWFLPATVLAVFGLLMMGCPSSGGGDDDDDATTAFSYEFKGDGSEYKAWGTDSPAITDGWVVFDKGGSTSAGFQIDFDTIGYKFKESDTLIFTYSVEITTPEACLSVKNPTGWKDLVAGAGYGIGAGKQHFLGSELKDANDVPLSIYDTPTKATWDAATKTGTFEVLMKHLGKVAIGIGFQHNTWAQSPADSSEVSKNANYKVKFLKVENAVGEAFKCDCGGDEAKCECGEGCDCDPCELDVPAGTQLKVKVGGVEQVAVAEVWQIPAGVGASIAYEEDGSGYQFNAGTANYGKAFAMFKVNLGAGKTLADFASVDLTYQGISGDIGWKPLHLLADGAATPFSTKTDDEGINTIYEGYKVSGVSYSNNGQAAQDFSFDIDTATATAADLTGSSVWISVYLHADPAVIKISDIKFVAK